MSIDSSIENSSNTVVSLRGVRKTYHVGEPQHALDDVSLDFPAGSYTAIMGPSGSGKSTLMNLVGFLDSPTEGTVHLEGENVTDDEEKTRLRRERIGFIFQQFNLMPRLSAVENVALPLVFQGTPRAERNRRAIDLLERVGLGNRTDHLPNELSGGQRQRVGIARALVNEPAILLADEPTGNLDTSTGETIMDLFAELHDDGKTIAVVTHENHIAARAERVITLVDGEVREITDLASTDEFEGIAEVID